ncbi:succinate receptor 1 [Sorex araneus]|uniref:succinate receptor 1 n=1 Tax=Sorex araneus TaxID=42254 RepID=UPI0024339E1D|nr:succinate receptor 1 [Sorex araneus]
MAWNASCTSWLEAKAALERFYLPIFYGIEFVGGILGNAVVVFGYIFCLKTWTSSNIYLFNLAISDLAFLCTLPVLIRTYALGGWAYGDALCLLNRYLLHANLYTSILFLALVSVDRYLLMQHPFRNHCLQRRAWAVLLSLGVWVLVTLELLPILSLIRPAGNSSSCTDYASSGDARSNLLYSLCLTVLGFLVPLGVMCGSYLKILFFLRRRTRRLASALPLEKPLRLVVLGVGIFSLLFTPYHVLRNMRIASRLGAWPQPGCPRVIIHTLYIISRPVAFLNSVINPVFYFLLGDHFRDMLMNTLRQHCKSLAPFRR